MYPLIQALRSELIAIIKRIDNGDCDISDVDDMNEVITVLRKTTHRDKSMSKYAAYEYLHISCATFNNYVTDGKITATLCSAAWLQLRTWNLGIRPYGYCDRKQMIL